jgi:hypothetical protein
MKEERGWGRGKGREVSRVGSRGRGRGREVREGGVKRSSGSVE